MRECANLGFDSRVVVVMDGGDYLGASQVVEEWVCELRTRRGKLLLYHRSVIESLAVLYTLSRIQTEGQCVELELLCKGAGHVECQA